MDFEYLIYYINILKLNDNHLYLKDLNVKFVPRNVAYNRNIGICLNLIQTYWALIRCIHVGYQVKRDLQVMNGYFCCFQFVLVGNF